MSLLKIGDKLKLKYTHEEVVILQQLDTSVYLVQKNKEKIPIHKDLLEIPKAKTGDEGKKGFYILVNPEIEYQQGADFLIQNIGILLENQTSQSLHLKYTIYIKNEIFFELENIPIESSQKISIHDFPFEKWHSSTFIVLDFTHRKKDVVNAKIQFQLKPKTIFKELQTAITKMREPILSFKQFSTLEDIVTKIDEIVLPEPFSIPQKNMRTSSLTEKLLPAVIDLHIEKIMPNYPLPKNEILPYQIDYFCKIIDKALQQGLDKITIIHGVGEGKLKKAIHDELSTQYKNHVFQYINQYHPQYGFGCTEIYFR